MSGITAHQADDGWWIAEGVCAIGDVTGVGRTRADAVRRCAERMAKWNRWLPLTAAMQGRSMAA